MIPPSLQGRILVCDGAMGTEIVRRLPGFRGAPELLNADQPDLIGAIHADYLEAGCGIIQTNTFGASRIKLAESGLESRIRELNGKALEIARDAIRKTGRKDALVLSDIGPTGKLPEPYGPLTFDALYENFREQAALLAELGTDGFIIETMGDLQETRAALIAVRDAAPRAFVICQMTFERNGRTLTGTDPATAVTVIDKLGADVAGVNCSSGPGDMKELIQHFCANTEKPVSCQPNAGLPILDPASGQTVFPMDPETFADLMEGVVETGATVIGGCCGTTPGHIRHLSRRFGGQSVRKPSIRTPAGLVLTGRGQVLRIGPSWPVRLIGERINPTANKPLAAGLVAGRLTELKETALSQTEAGADALDVNISTPNVDEKSVLPKSVLTLQNLVPLPLVIDSTDLDAIEAGLRACAGRCLLNSVSGKPGSAERLMPMAKKYGAALVLLPVDERGIPRTAEERIEVLERLLSAALKAGFSRNDLIADGLVMAAATGQSWVPETLRTIRLARERLGLASILGVSNVSFGFPNRPILNANFLAMACAAGLDAAIINPSSEPMRQALDASAVLTGRDPNGRAYIGRYASAPRDPDQTGGPSTEDPLRKAVLQGARSEAPIIASDAMKSGRSARDLLDTVLLPAMTEVGRLYEKGTYFLPQLILAAETMQEALKVIKPALAVQGSSPSAKGRLVIATVKGDVHDIGKNIVSLMLENDGWAVLDLGKDVPNEAIIEAAISHRADLVCLSALMTTTMTEMSAVAGLLKTRGLTCGLLVGGAAVNARFAEGIGAGYAPDAFAAIRAASRFLPKRAAT